MTRKQRHGVILLATVLFMGIVFTNLAQVQADRLYFTYAIRFAPLSDVLESNGYAKLAGTRQNEIIYFKKQPEIRLTIDLVNKKVMKNQFAFEIADQYRLNGGKLYMDIGVLSAVINKKAVLTGNYVAFKALDTTPHCWTSLDAGLVTHAAGGIDGIDGTNSYEALIKNYNLGHRVFEIDFNLTTDGRLAAVHDWHGYNGPKSSEQFEKIKIRDKYTSMRLEDVLDIMTVNQDMYLVTDTKSFEYSDQQIVQQFKEIYDQAVKRGASVLDRIIPQIYNQKMYDLVKTVYPFKSIIYTLYASGDTDDQVVAFVKSKSDIKAVTMGPVRYSDRFKAGLDTAGKLIYFFTLNDPKEIQGYKNIKAHGFYTDFVTAPEISGG